MNIMHLWEFFHDGSRRRRITGVVYVIGLELSITSLMYCAPYLRDMRITAVSLDQLLTACVRRSC